MKKAVLIIIVMILTAIQGLCAYVYTSGQFAEIYNSFGQALPTLYKPIAVLLDSDISYKLMVFELILGIVLVAKDKFTQTYFLLGAMMVIVFLMIFGLYGNLIQP